MILHQDKKTLMKKLKLLAIIACLLIAGSNVIAQKTGYIRVDDMVVLLPETKKLDSLIQRFQADSLNPQFAYLVQEYNRKDSMINTRDSVKLSPVVRGQIRQELEGIAYQVQNWQAYVQQATENKQQQFLAPLYRKVLEAINTVAKEAGYTYVYNKEALLVAPTADDILPLVAKKLNVKLPVSAQAGTGTKPPVKTGN